MKNLLLGFILFLTMFRASGQYFNFSQYNFAAQRVSPTAPALSDYASLGFIYRSQGTASDIRMKSNLLSASYPFINKNSGRRWSGLGVTLMDDRSGDLFKIQEASLSYAVNINLTPTQSIQLGLKSLYQQRSMDMEGLSTGIQYVADRGFDETLPSGESNGIVRTSYMTFSSGLSWQNVNEEGVRTGLLSVSLFDFNNVNESVLGKESMLHKTVITQFSFRLFKESNLSMFPEALYTNTAGNNVYNVGLVTRCDVKGTRTSSAFHVDVLTKYVVGRSGIFGLQFQNEKFALGLSYDFLMKKENVSNIGALEVALELRQLVNPKPKKLIARPSASKPLSKAQVPPRQTKQPAVSGPVRKIETPAVTTLSERLKQKRDSIAKATPATKTVIELERHTLHFNFESNSSELDESSQSWLDELAQAMIADSKIDVRLTGHTDNVGSPGFNQRLSVSRATSVRDYLVGKGIASTRITVEGKGMSEPLNQNRTEADRAANRRVVVTIISKK